MTEKSTIPVLFFFKKIKKKALIDDFTLANYNKTG